MTVSEYTSYRINPETMEDNVEQPHPWGKWVTRQEVDKLLEARDVEIKRLKKKNKRLKKEREIILGMNLPTECIH